MKKLKQIFEETLKGDDTREIDIEGLGKIFN